MARFDIETNIEQTTGLFSQFGGVIGTLPALFTRATTAVRTFTAALAANPIGLVLVAISTAIALVTSALSTLQPVIDRFNQVLAGFSAAWAFLNDEILEALGLIDDVNGSFRDNIAAAVALEAATQRLRDRRQAFIVTESELNLVLQQSRLTAQDQTNTEQERIAALEVARTAQNRIFAERLVQAQEEERIARASSALATDDAEANEALQQAIANTNNVRAAAAVADATLVAMQSALIRSEQRRFEALDAQAQSIESGRIAFANQQQLDFLTLAMAGEVELAETRATQAAAEIGRIDVLLNAAFDANASREELDRLTMEREAALDRSRQANHDANIIRMRVQMETEMETTDASLGLASQVGSTLQQIAGENKGLAIAGLIVGQATSVASAIVDTVRANAAAVAASPLTAGQPFVAINTISAGLGIASAIAATVEGIAQINAAGGPPASGGGGAPSGPTVRTPTGVASTQAAMSEQITAMTNAVMSQADPSVLLTPASGPGSLTSTQRANTRRNNRQTLGRNGG